MGRVPELPESRVFILFSYCPFCPLSCPSGSATGPHQAASVLGRRPCLVFLCNPGPSALRQPWRRQGHDLPKVSTKTERGKGLLTPPARPFYLGPAEPAGQGMGHPRWGSHWVGEATGWHREDT